MASNIEVFLKNFISSWQVARIYELKHPKFVDSVEQAYASLNAALGDKKEVAVGIFGEELASGDDIFFELSKRMIHVISNFKDKGVERIIFRKGTTREELVKFISFLVVTKEEVKTGPQDYLSFLGIKNIIVGKITVPNESAVNSFENKGKIRADFERITRYENCLDNLSQSLDTFLNDDKFNYSNLKFILNDIMDNLMVDYQAFFTLAKTKSHDLSTFRHLLNVSTLSIYLGHKLGFCKDDCLAIGTAAIFHDIGKLYIARQIVQKSGKLDEEEFDKIRSHTILGAELLLKYVDTLTVLPVIVALEHHLDYDLSGYPKVFFQYKPHAASLIVSICDVYDALTQRRSYKNDYPPEMIYNIMMGDKGKKFEPLFLDKFFRIIGVWPKGTIVSLKDERIAIVRDINESDIFSPKVEVVSGGERSIVDLLKENDVKIKSSLNPHNEGKKYLDLI